MNRFPLFLLLLLAASAGLVFAPVLLVNFCQDDYVRLFRAEHATIGDLIANFGNLERRFYRPVQEFYFAVQLRLFGLDPFAFHITNLLFLVVNSWLIFLFCRRLGICNTGAAASALFYCCHPAFMTLVMWSSAGSSLLAVFFSLLTLLLALSRHGASNVALVPFALALASREISVVIPFLLCLLFWISSERTELSLRSAISTIKTTFHFWFMMAIYLAIRIALVSPEAKGPAYDMDLGFHILTNLKLLMEFATGLPPVASASLGPVISATFKVLFWLTIFIVSLILLKRRKPYAAAGIVWFFICIIPFIPLSHHAMEAYYLDTALIGLSLTIGIFIHELILSQRQKLPTSLLCAGFLGAYLLLSIFSVNQERSASPVTMQAQFAQTLSEDMKRLHPELPKGAILFFQGTNKRMLAATGFGDLFRLVYRDPTIKTLFSHRGDLLPIQEKALFIVELKEDRLIEISRPAE